MEIKIKDQTIKIKYGFKALMIYERIEDKLFNPETIGDIIMFFYCCVIASNFEITYDDFIEWLDENPEKVNEFSMYLKDVIEATTLKKEKEKENK